eukprot:1152698-Pelagomonas_calceolata.AAC.17
MIARKLYWGTWIKRLPEHVELAQTSHPLQHELGPMMAYAQVHATASNSCRTCSMLGCEASFFSVLVPSFVPRRELRSLE